MTTVLAIALTSLAGLSLALTLWQWLEARCFPLHRRACDPGVAPAVTLLKPLKGSDAESEGCLRSWLAQEYPGPVQVLFGVAADDDPVVAVVRRLQAEFPHADAQLRICPARLGANAKVSTLTHLERDARHEVLVISDADVRVPPDFLLSLVAPLRDPRVGVVNPFYRLANPGTLAMRWEAIGVNADFWSSVLQSRRLQPLRYALGAVMAVRRPCLAEVGGFAALGQMLADDFELGRRVAQRGASIAICPVPAECWESPKGWGEVWRHQLRWARTIRVCMPGPYAASVLSNATLWPLLWVALWPNAVSATGAAACLVVRIATAADNQGRMMRSRAHWPWMWLAPLKDLLQFVLWALSFLGSTVEWRGERFRVLRTGELTRLPK